MNNFALATLHTPNGPTAAIQVDGQFYILDDDPASGPDTSVLSLIRDWEVALPMLEARAQSIRSGAGNRSAVIDPHVLTPVQYPDKLLAVGANYSGHLKEMGLAVEKWASMPFFLRPPETTLVGPGQTVVIPASTKEFDWECELAVIIGRRLHHASREEAARAVIGYSVGLDLSCRDLIMVDNDLKVDLLRGKAQDTMAPCGPVMMPAKFVPDVDDLRITLSVNDERMMDASTSEMLYKIEEQLQVISEFITLEPGDILFTGSPSGSAGVHGNRWLKPGDRIHAEIEHVGVLDVTMRGA